MIRQKVLLVKKRIRYCKYKIMLDFIQISSHIMGGENTHFMEDRIQDDYCERP